MSALAAWGMVFTASSRSDLIFNCLEMNFFHHVKIYVSLWLVGGVVVSLGLARRLLVALGGGRARLLG